MIKDLMKDYTGSLASFQNPDRVHVKMKQKSMKQGIAMEYPFASFLQECSFQLNASLKFHMSIQYSFFQTLLQCATVFIEMKPNSSTRLKSTNLSKVAQKKQASETYSKNYVAIAQQCFRVPICSCQTITMPLHYHTAYVLPPCGSRNKVKEEILEKHILIVILNDKVSSYDELVLQIRDCSLSNKWIHNIIIIIIIIIFKCCHLDWHPQYLKDLFSL